MGHWIGETYQGRGYMRGAVAAPVPSVFVFLDIDMSAG